MSGSQLEVWVDCHRAFRRLAPQPMTNFSELEHKSLPLDPTDAFLGEAEALRDYKGVDKSDTTPTAASYFAGRDEPISLYLGQRNSKHFLFKVRLSLQYIIEAAGRFNS